MQLSFASLLVLVPLVSALPGTTSNGACSQAGITAARAQEVENAFRSAKIIPDVVPSIRPTIDFKLSYNGRPMNLGNTYGTVETLAEPKYEFAPEKDRDPATTKYTIIYVDPDAPGPETPLLRYFLHYIQYDVQPSCITNQVPKTLATYMPLTPLSVSTHRYTYLIYRQPPGPFKRPELNPVLAVARAPFNLQQFVEENHLELVGGNFMREGLGTAGTPVLPPPTN